MYVTLVQMVKIFTGENKNWRGSQTIQTIEDEPFLGRFLEKYLKIEDNINFKVKTLHCINGGMCGIFWIKGGFSLKLFLFQSERRRYKRKVSEDKRKKRMNLLTRERY
jgi:hypothetical protein